MTEIILRTDPPFRFKPITTNYDEFYSGESRSGVLTNFTLENHAQAYRRILLWRITLRRIDEFYSGESRSGESTNFTLENHALANHCTQLLSMSLSVQYASLISSLNQLN